MKKVISFCLVMLAIAAVIEVTRVGPGATWVVDDFANQGNTYMCAQQMERTILPGTGEPNLLKTTLYTNPTSNTLFCIKFKGILENDNYAKTTKLNIKDTKRYMIT